MREAQDAGGGRRGIPAEWEVLDERFQGIGGEAYVEEHFDGGRWLEGPAYSPLWRTCCSVTSPTTGSCASTS